jgi:hypothetical protein
VQRYRVSVEATPEVLTLWGAPPGVAVGPQGRPAVSMRNILIFKEIWTQDIVCILVGT